MARDAYFSDRSFYTPRAGSGFSGLAIMASVIYGFVLASLPIDAFVDRANYLGYLNAENTFQLLNSYASTSLFVAFFNEPIWLAASGGLATVFDSETSLRLMIFSSATAFCFIVLRNLQGHAPLYFFAYAVLILTTPQILKNYIIHLRQGFAIAVFMLLAFNFRSYWRLALAATVAALIHSSFFIIFALTIIFAMLEWFRPNTVYKLGIITLVLFAGAYYLEGVASVVGARQGALGLSGDETSGIGFVFWLFIFSMICVAANVRAVFRMNRQMEISIAMILVYLIYYFYTPYAARIFESGMPQVYLALFSIRGIFGKLIVAALAFQFAYAWLPALLGGTVFRAAG